CAFASLPSRKRLYLLIGASYAHGTDAAERAESTCDFLRHTPDATDGGAGEILCRRARHRPLAFRRRRHRVDRRIPQGIAQGAQAVDRFRSGEISAEAPRARQGRSLQGRILSRDSTESRGEAVSTAASDWHEEGQQLDAPMAQRRL